MSLNFLGIATQSLRGRSPTQYPKYNHTIECTQTLLKFYMYAEYKSHGNATLSYMDHAFPRIHTFRDVSFDGQASQMAKADANALRTELMKQRKVHEETNSETWMPSKKRREMNSWRNCISHKIDVSKKLDADFNFPKIHWMSHSVEQIHLYTALQH